MDETTQRLQLACEVMQQRLAQKEVEVINLTVDLIRERQKNAELTAEKKDEKVKK